MFALILRRGRCYLSFLRRILSLLLPLKLMVQELMIIVDANSLFVCLVSLLKLCRLVFSPCYFVLRMHFPVVPGAEVCGRCVFEWVAFSRVFMSSTSYHRWEIVLVG